MRSLFFIFFVFIFNCGVLAQIDITRYATDDLFKAKPVITKELLEKNANKEVAESFFQRDINVGMEYWNTNQLDDAAHHFTIMTQMYPKQASIHYYLGAVLYDKKSYDEAIESLKESLDIDPLLLESKYLIGLIQIEKEEIQEARKTMEVLINVPLYTAYGYHGMALVATAENNVFKAKRMYEKCLKTDSTFKEAYIPLTFIDLILGDGLKRSLRRLNKAVRVDSTWQQARIVRAMLSIYKDGNLDQFERDINTLIRQAPNNYHYYSIKGYLDIELKNYRSAVENFRMAFNLEIDTTNVGEYKFYTKLEQNKSLQSALNYYNKKFHQLDDKSRKYIDLGICEFINENHKQALIFYETASNNQKSPVVDFLKAVLFENQLATEYKAIQLYSDVIEKDSTYVPAYTNRGNIYFKREDYKLAHADFSKIVELMPESKEGYKARGILLLKMRRYVKAYHDFTRALMCDSTDTDLFFNRGTAALWATYFDNSIQDFNIVLNKKPNDGEAYYMQSLNYLYKSDTLRSIALLDSASRLKKYNQTYHKELLWLAKRQNLVDYMQNAHDRLVKYYSWKSDYRIERGKFYLRQHKFEKALNDFMILIKRNKRHAAGFYYLGKTQIALGDSKSGNKSIDKARKLGYKE